MAITGNASYIPTMDQFLAHWTDANAALAPAALVVGLPNGTTVTRAQFLALRDTLYAQEITVAAKANLVEVARGEINLKKTQLLKWFNEFIELFEGYYSGTKFMNAKPHAPSFKDGQGPFTKQMFDLGTLWEMVNTDPLPPPPPVTLPIILADLTEQGPFMSYLAGLQVSYSLERIADQQLNVARGARNLTQAKAYEVMKLYRKLVPAKCANFPVIVETLPRLSPLPGHTPDPVAASALFQQPDLAHVVYELSTDGQLDRYVLRGNIGDEYNEDDAVTIATNQIGDPPEFTTNFGLTQVGAKVTLKVFVILTTDREAGSAPMVVERVAQVLPLAA